jgi:hypothetical protein
MSTLFEHSDSPPRDTREDGHGAATRGVDVGDASRLLTAAAHDIAVALTCIGLGDLDEAHTNILTARVAADAAEETLRAVLEAGA